jgi:glycosyltransferase involved in cell wall biosynthesis
VRVIHVAPTEFGSGGLFGGGERYPQELARALARHVPCELVTFGAETRRWREPSGLERRTLRAVAYPGHFANPLAPALPAALRRADVVHVHHPKALPSRIAALTGRALGRCTFATDHGLPGGDWGGLLPRLFDAYLLVSAFSARRLGRLPARTRLIYGGADPVRYAPGPAIVRRGVLFVGRITPHKGVDRLVQAVPAGVPLTLAGTFGHDRGFVSRDFPRLLRRLAEGKDLRILSPVADADLPALYRHAAVSVLPSVFHTCYGDHEPTPELLGLAVLEAMASGTPVIASRLGGLPEIVQDGITGFLVEPGDVRALRERIGELLGNPALADRMGRAARELVLERFTWDAVARRCLEEYDRARRRDQA